MVTPVPAAFAITLGCASCRKPIDTDKTLINEVPPGQLPRMAMLLSGRMPDPSQPGEVLASFTLAVESSILPQVIGWYVLAGLAALAALAVIGQAVARQGATERADHPALSAVGVRPRQLVAAALIRAALIGAAGAIGAVLAAVLASPLTPVGEARIAAAPPGRMSFDPWALPLGGVALVAAVTALSVWPAVRHARLLRPRPPRRPAPVAMAVSRPPRRPGCRPPP